jgi:hypothetical protein
MNRKPLHTDESWENDAVWKLLDQVPPLSAHPRFVDDTLRAARLTANDASPWWRRAFSPIPLAGFAAAATAVIVAIFSWVQPLPDSNNSSLADSRQAAEIQDIAEAETLIAAVDHLDAFSDTELVSLIGF